MVKHFRREANYNVVGSILDKYIFVQECVCVHVMHEPRGQGHERREALNEHKGGWAVALELGELWQKGKRPEVYKREGLPPLFWEICKVPYQMKVGKIM